MNFIASPANGSYNNRTAGSVFKIRFLSLERFGMIKVERLFARLFLIPMVLFMIVSAAGCKRGSRIVGETSEYTAESVAEQLAAEQAASEAAREK
jgi:hypothetical protein